MRKGCPFIVVFFLGILFYALFPAIYFLFGTCLTFVGAFESCRCISDCFDKCIEGRSRRRRFKYRDCFRTNSDKKCTGCLLSFLKIFVIVIWYILVWALIFTIGCLFYALSVVPLWIMFLVVIFLVGINWFPEGLLNRLFCCKRKAKAPKPTKSEK